MTEPVFYSLWTSPIGALVLSSDGVALMGVSMTRASDGAEPDIPPAWRRDESRFGEVRRQLSAYFEGELRDFDLPMRLVGTPFQRRVWRELCTIPFGAAISYLELARRLGIAGGSRAVGQANGRNPIALVVPCHRVIAADGGLGGYGGGLDRKRMLLEHEAEALERHPEWRADAFPGAIRPRLLAGRRAPGLPLGAG